MTTPSRHDTMLDTIHDTTLDTKRGDKKADT
jgi:hypothetical protein